MFGFGNRAAEVPAAPRLPMRFRLGGAVAIADLQFRANQGAFAFEPPAGDQIVEALGKVDLGAGATLHRMYLTDDAWIQVNTTAGVVDGCKLFVFVDTINPSTFADFNAWVQEGSLMGGPKYRFRSRDYDRVWGDSPYRWAPPVPYEESVSHVDKSQADFTCKHYSMLYQRQVPELQGTYEYLFISAEWYSENEWLICISLGTDVSEADLTIT